MGWVAGGSVGGLVRAFSGWPAQGLVEQPGRVFGGNHRAARLC